MIHAAGGLAWSCLKMQDTVWNRCWIFCFKACSYDSDDHGCTSYMCSNKPPWLVILGPACGISGFLFKCYFFPPVCTVGWGWTVVNDDPFHKCSWAPAVISATELSLFLNCCSKACLVFQEFSDWAVNPSPSWPLKHSAWLVCSVYTCHHLLCEMPVFV